MKILIYGGKGWIGKQFIEILNNDNDKNIIFKIANERVNDTKDFYTEIDLFNPTHIICFIGRTHGIHDNKIYPTIDYLELKGKLKDNINDNLYSPLILATYCTKKNIHFTYLGTGCIFNYNDTHLYGNENTGFDESDNPNFFGSSYSIVKGYTDRIMHLFENTCLNLRIRMPIIGEHNPRNFITKITSYEKVCSIPNSMTVLPELLPLVFNMMKNNTVGTINLSNPGVISHNEILDLYAKYVDKNFTYKNFTIEEQDKILACERSNNCLDTKRLVQLFPNVKNIKESIENLMINYKIS